MIIGVILGGLLTGKIIIAVGLGQSWWPVPVSGEPEVVIHGTLKQMPSGEAGTIGLSLETAAGKESIDLNRVSAESTNRIIDQKVVIRGVRREGRLSTLDKTGKYQVGSFVEASWVKPSL